jgi:hypothetical protein
MTIERLWADCIDVRELRRRGILGDDGVTIGPTLKWPRIAKMVVRRYLVTLRLHGQLSPQLVPISWTRVHLGGQRPWLHCPHCEGRVAKLYRGMGGYFCRACVGNPFYASQSKSAQGRRHFQACKLRLLLDGEARLSAPFPQRPRGMHRRTYERLRRRLVRLEAGLPKRWRNAHPDYPNLVAYVP